MERYINIIIELALIVFCMTIFYCKGQVDGETSQINQTELIQNKYDSINIKLKEANRKSYERYYCLMLIQQKPKGWKQEADSLLKIIGTEN